MDSPTTQIGEINLQPSWMQDYSAYLPVQLGELEVATFVDSGNTFANVILQQTMVALGIEASQLEPIPQLSVGTAAAGKKMKILGQAPQIELLIGQHLAKFRICPLVVQGLVHPLNLCGPFLRWAGIDQIHSRGVLRIQGKEVPMCSPQHTGKSPPLQPSSKVCTLHLATPSSGRQQYTPNKPTTEACSGPEPVRLQGRSRCVVPVQLSTPSPRWGPGAVAAHNSFPPRGQPGSARGTTRWPPRRPGRQSGIRGAPP